MENSSNIVVEVIVWEGIFDPFNPWGHVTTRIEKNGIIYSYSLEDPNPPKDPHIVCNTEPFTKLEKHEQGIRNGFGFVLNLTKSQARIIFLSMQRRFHAYNSPSCKYGYHAHNCTYAIQKAIQEAGINFKKFISDNPLTYVHYSSRRSSNQTMLPAFVEQGLLQTKNNHKWLVKDIVRYKKGKTIGLIVKEDKVDLVFHLKAMHTDRGWHAINDAFENRWDPLS